jgi:Ni/Co efflux regulator RcnB
MKAQLMTTTLPVLAVGLALATGAPAAADPPHCPPGHARQGVCEPGEPSRHREAQAYEQGYRDGQRDAWQVGDRFGRTDYVVIREPDRYGLRRPPQGHYYVRVDEEVLLIEAATQLVADLVDR